MAHILIAEDDPHIRHGIAATLASEGHTADPAADGDEALLLYRRRPPDLILLDIMMPRKSGYDVCREIRSADPSTPILFLTAKGEEFDKVLGLTLGADDYITKPFGIRELLARVAAALRRAAAPVPAPADPETFDFGGLRVDAKRYLLHAPAGPQPLSDREMKLLRHFHARPGEVLTRDALLSAVWGIAYFGNTRTLDQHIAQLRKKLALAPSPIATVHGIGYRYDACPPS